MDAINVSHFKTHAIPPSHSLVSHGKKKLKKAHEAIKENIANVLSVDENVLDDDPRGEETILRNKADEFNRLMSLLKDKVKQTEKPSEKNKGVNSCSRNLDEK